MNINSFQEHAFLNLVTEVIEANLKNDQFGVTFLASELAMSRSNLHRKIKSETGKSVSQFVSQIRLEKAGKLLRETSLPVSDIAFDTGFHSVSYFSKCFHEYFGVSPRHFRQKKKFLTIRNSKYKIRIPIIKSIILLALAVIAILIFFLLIK